MISILISAVPLSVLHAVLTPNTHLVVYLEVYLCSIPNSIYLWMFLQIKLTSNVVWVPRIPVTGNSNQEDLEHGQSESRSNLRWDKYLASRRTCVFGCFWGLGPKEVCILLPIVSAKMPATKNRSDRTCLICIFEIF